MFVFFSAVFQPENWADFDDIGYRSPEK